MIHFSCDRCKCEIDPDHDLRYIVRIEVEAAMDNLAAESVDDSDHLGDLEEMLASADDYCESDLSDELYQRKRYDLCSKCYRQFMLNPISRESSVPFGFSNN